jgi:transcriptional regulator with XRE-family HTH domain
MISRQEFRRKFGKLFAQRRLEAKMSQRAVADALGLSRASIANIERGRQSVSLHMVYLLAEVLERDLLDLLPLAKGIAAKQQLPNKQLSRISPRERQQLDRLTPKESIWLNKIARAGSQRI